ncbi:hypothetical protein K435DRAFT_804801 [Dendrothele bispora CBS 962.96]|uniref:Uncharacterized protein n=1 Tax=Dendrothele bispora (strain CBS 962.96) TaxID=1314807 RepID=A0A4S8LD73_DENBC|nr:hypothetical protein K435DRAFT_804801 [Dendrothele bispora CBS 962.96]
MYGPTPKEFLLDSSTTKEFHPKGGGIGLLPDRIGSDSDGIRSDAAFQGLKKAQEVLQMREFLVIPMPHSIRRLSSDCRIEIRQLEEVKMAPPPSESETQSVDCRIIRSGLLPDRMIRRSSADCVSDSDGG